MGKNFLANIMSSLFYFRNIDLLLNIKIFKTHAGAGAMVPSVKYLLCKHEDLNLTPQTQVKKSVVVCASKVETKVWGC